MLPEKVIKSAKKERIISGLLYLSVLNLLIGLLALGFVYQAYRKKSRYLKFHFGEAGILWIFNSILFLFSSWIILPIFPLFRNPFFFRDIYSALGLLTLGIVYIAVYIALDVTIIILAFYAFKGRSFRISRIVDFLKNKSNEN